MNRINDMRMQNSRQLQTEQTLSALSAAGAKLIPPHRRGRPRKQMWENGPIFAHVVCALADSDPGLTAEQIADFINERLGDRPHIMPKDVSEMRLRFRRDGKVPASPHPGVHVWTQYGRGGNSN